VHSLCSQLVMNAEVNCKELIKHGVKNPVSTANTREALPPSSLHTPAAHSSPPCTELLREVEWWSEVQCSSGALASKIGHRNAGHDRKCGKTCFAFYFLCTLGVWHW
jgi:hypothetical protein